MGDVVRLHKEFTAVELLESFLEQARAGELVSVIVVAREASGDVVCHSMTGTSAIERAGMCAYAEQVMLDSLQRI